MAGPFRFNPAAPLVQPRLKGSYLFLQSELLLFELPDAQRVGAGSGHFLLDGLIQIAVTISQFANASVNGHGLRLHV